jgi:hypothetical protein
VGALGGGIGPGVAVAQSRVELVRLPVPRYDGTLTPYTFEFDYLLVTVVYDTLLWRDAEGSRGPGWRVW